MDLIAKSQYILTLCQFSGNLILDGHKKSAEELQNESSCRNLCKEIESRLKVCRNSEIPELLEAYDMLHRIGYGKQSDQLLLTKYKSRVYNAWRSGNHKINAGENRGNKLQDSRIEESQIFAMLSKDLRSNPGLTGIRSKILDRWVSILKKYNRFPEITTYENYQRLSLLMRENLDCYFEDADEAKWNWYQANRIDKEEFQNLSAELLKSYRRFNTSLFPSVLDYEEQQETDNIILEELITRFDLNPYECEAYHKQLFCHIEINS